MCFLTGEDFVFTISKDDRYIMYLSAFSSFSYQRDKEWS